MKALLILLLFPCSMLAQVVVSFTPSTSPGVQHEIYWGEQLGSQAFYVSVPGSPYVIEDRWLEFGVKYYLFVIARGSSGKASGKSSVVFVYGQPTDILAPDSPINVKVGMTYPNPFNSTLNIRAGLEVEIYNLLGHSIGEFSNQWDASNYPSGFYFIVDSLNIEKVTLFK